MKADRGESQRPIGSGLTGMIMLLMKKFMMKDAGGVEKGFISHNLRKDLGGGESQSDSSEAIRVGLYRACPREGYLEAHYYHQQEKIDEWKRNWQLEMSHASKCEERVKKLEEKIDRLKEGINAALSYNLPYLVEKALK